MTDDFILEEDESESLSSRRPFFIAVGVLATVGILAVACIAITLISRPSDQTDEIAAIETRNAFIELTNEAVTRTVVAMRTEAARPTDTPQASPTSTATSIPTNTPRPSDTPVVAQADEEETADSGVSGTRVFGTGAGDNTPTPIAPLGGGTDGGSLPETGISTLGASVAAILLLAVLVVARRLRRS
jgi:hypothetical protein